MIYNDELQSIQKERCWVNRAAFLSFSYRVIYSLQNLLSPDEIRTTHLLNMSLELQRLPLRPDQSQDIYRSTKIPPSPNIKIS